MAIGGCIFRMTKAGIAVLQDESEKANEEVEGFAPTGPRHPDNPKTSQSSIIRSPLI